MAVLSTTPRNAFNSHHTTLKTSMVSGTQTTSIVLNALIRNGSTVSWAATSGGILRFYRGTNEEHIGYGSATVDSTTKDVTLVDVTRDLPWNDGTSFTTAGGGMAWPAGTFVDLVVDARHMQNNALRDQANTFSGGVQTFNVPVIVSGTTTYITVPSLTTTQRDALVGVNGMIIYNTSTGRINSYEGGAWGTSGSTTVTDATTAVAGKVEIGTVAEQAAHTATGGTGATIVPSIGNLVTLAADGTWISGAIPTLNTAKFIDGSIGGTGVASPVLGALLIGGGAGLAMTPIGPGSNRQIPLSNGTTLAMSNLPVFSKPVFSSTTNSTTLTNPTSSTAYDTHTYTIPANDLINGVWYTFEARITVVHGTSGTFTPGVGLGAATDVAINPFAATTGTENTYIRGTIMGKAAASASSAVSIELETRTDNSGTSYSQTALATVNKATDGTLALTFFALFGTSNAGNNTVVATSIITKHSTTAFIS